MTKGTPCALSPAGECSGSARGPRPPSPWPAAATQAPTDRPLRRFPPGAGEGPASPKPKPTATVRPIGDGSTSFTGKQPHQPGRPVPLEPGQTPPQFVVFSWDGAGEVGNGLFPRFLDLAKQYGASMTFFLSGIYLLPESKKRLYDPPNNPRGASDIGYLTDAHIKDTLRNLRRAWLEGHEIGTHFNGHFCAAPAASAPGPRSSGVTRSSRRSRSSRSGAPTPDGPTWSPCRSTTTRSWWRPHPVCSGRTSCCPPPVSWAGATTPPRPADARSGPPRSRAYGTFRSSRYLSPDGLSRSSRWTTTCSPISRSTPPTPRPTTIRAGGSSRHRRTYPAFSGHTRPTGRPSSSATTSSSGTAASTWTPSRRP